MPTRNQILKKYSSSYVGFSFHCLFFDKEKNLIGSFIFIPKVFRYLNNEILGLLLLDTSFPYLGKVNPFSIKKAVFELFEYCEDFFEEECFLYGFPNKYIEKLWNSLLRWKYIDTIKPVFDICPFLTIISQEYTLLNDDRQLNLKSHLLKYNPRFFSFCETFLHTESNALNIWLVKNIFPIQIIDNLNINLRPKIFKRKNLLMLWRLFFPSILGTNSSRKVKPWHFLFKNKSFPMYILDKNNIFEFKKTIFNPSFIWNDVP